MSQDHFNLLFLSSRNTARSIFAESVTNRLGRGKFTGFSAGMKPAEAADPMVLDILRLSKYSAEGLRPKSWAEFTQADAPRLRIYSLRPRSWRAASPLAGAPDHCRLALSRPRAAERQGWERRKRMSEMLAGLERQLGAFMLLPFHTLDQISLHSRLEELRQGAEAH
jgi:arsenate reductase (thioredoxin)